MKASILIPSIRPQQVDIRIKQINSQALDFDYEIIVISQFKTEGNNVLWIDEGPELLLNNRALQKGFEQSTGDYIISTVDLYRPTQNCMRKILHFTAAHKAPFVAAFDRVEDHPFLFEKRDEHNRIIDCGILIPCTNCVSRETIAMLSYNQIENKYLHDPIYQKGFLDCDLALEVDSLGGCINICSKATNSEINQSFDDLHGDLSGLPVLKEDLAAFKNKWGNSYKELLQ